MHSNQWAGGAAPVHFGKAVNWATKCLRVVGNWSKTSGGQDCGYETADLTGIGVKKINRNGQDLVEQLKPQSALAIA